MLAACRGYQCGSWVSNARLIRFLKLGRMDCNSSLFLVHSSFLSIFRASEKACAPPRAEMQVALCICAQPGASRHVALGRDWP